MEWSNMTKKFMSNKLIHKIINQSIEKTPESSCKNLSFLGLKYRGKGYSSRIFLLIKYCPILLYCCIRIF